MVACCEEDAETRSTLAAGDEVQVTHDDFSRVLAGPFCTALLGEMGAEVIKIEMPGRGDDSRQFSPFRDGESGLFMLVNKAKKNLLHSEHQK